LFPGEGFAIPRKESGIRLFFFLGIPAQERSGIFLWGPVKPLATQGSVPIYWKDVKHLNLADKSPNNLCTFWYGTDIMTTAKLVAPK